MTEATQPKGHESLGVSDDDKLKHVQVVRAADFKYIFADTSAALPVNAGAIDVVLLTNAPAITEQKMRISGAEFGHETLLPAGVEVALQFFEAARLRLAPKGAMDLATNILRVLMYSGQIQRGELQNQMDGLNALMIESGRIESLQDG